MAEAAIAIGLLAVLAAAGWWKNARSQKQVGELTILVETLLKGVKDHDREHTAINEYELTGDLSDDAEFLRDHGDG